MATKPGIALATAAVAIAALAAAFYVLNREESAAAEQSTDDATVQADFTVVAPRIAGLIAAVEVEDHREVKAGDPLVTIDDRDWRIAVASAQARVAAARAAIESLEAQIERQASVIEQARAAALAAAAQVKLAAENRRRFANLARDGSGTVQAQQQAEAQWAIHSAGRERDEAGLQSARQQTGILRAELEKARAALAAAQADQAAAELNLAHTRIAAPAAGVVAQRRARVGGYVRVGEPLLTLVPLDAIYIEARFRETQLARVRVGQKVDIAVDALPGVRFTGRVESLGPASGASFSVVPPHNAGGNFTKIVQRLPVRIRLDPAHPQAPRLRVGMSVRPTVFVED
ncbi:MAG: HlyD family secretion protein [Candidatus Accumulibacter sp.]|jgi:membrane fusion protein (multidrug efflux system)|nr:HlyD family secretion protein [Accumulibacter sp.]